MENILGDVLFMVSFMASIFLAISSTRFDYGFRLEKPLTIRVASLVSMNLNNILNYYIKIHIAIHQWLAPGPNIPYE